MKFGCSKAKSLNKINNTINTKFYNKLSTIIKELDKALLDKALTEKALTDKASKNISNFNKILLDYSSFIYNKGISANNLLDYFKNRTNFKSDYSKFIFFFDIYKREVRIEEYLIFIILYFYSHNCIIDYALFNVI